MNFSYTDENDFLVLAIRGEIRVNNILELKKEFQNLVVEKHNLALDMKDVRLVDSSGISLLVNMYKRLSGQSRRFCIYNIPDQVHKIFTEINLDQYIPLYATREEFIQDNVAIVEDELYPPPEYDFEGKLFKIKNLKCLLCDAENLKGFVLNKQSQEAHFEPGEFVPQYRGKSGNNDLDIYAMQVTVCPSCFFASRHLNYFTDIKGEFTSILNEKERYALLRESSNRKRLVGGTTMDSIEKFYPPFSPNEAFWVYRLAEECAHSLYRLENRLATYDMAMYNIQIARFCGERDFPEYLRKAYMWYGEIHKNQGRYAPPTVIEALYYLCFTSVRLKRLKDSEKYLADFRELGSAHPSYPLYLKAAESLFDPTKK